MVRRRNKKQTSINFILCFPFILLYPFVLIKDSQQFALYVPRSQNIIPYFTHFTRPRSFILMSGYKTSSYINLDLMLSSILIVLTSYRHLCMLQLKLNKTNLLQEISFFVKVNKKTDDKKITVIKVIKSFSKLLKVIFKLEKTQKLIEFILKYNLQKTQHFLTTYIENKFALVIPTTEEKSLFQAYILFRWYFFYFLDKLFSIILPNRRSLVIRIENIPSLLFRKYIGYFCYYANNNIFLVEKYIDYKIQKGSSVKSALITVNFGLYIGIIDHLFRNMLQNIEINLNFIIAFDVVVYLTIEDQDNYRGKKKTLVTHRIYKISKNLFNEIANKASTRYKRICLSSFYKEYCKDKVAIEIYFKDHKNASYLNLNTPYRYLVEFNIKNNELFLPDGFYMQIDKQKALWESDKKKQLISDIHDKKEEYIS